MASVKDTFANRAYCEVVESGANTLTFKEMESGFGILEKRAWVINRIDYYIGVATRVLPVASGDLIRMGVCLSNAIPDVGLERPEVVDLFEIQTYEFGTAANDLFMETPTVREFSDLPGGGILVTPKPIYGFVQGVSIASAATIEMRIYFTILDLKDADFLQLLEMSRMIQ